MRALRRVPARRAAADRAPVVLPALDPALARGVNVVDGKVTYQPVAEATGHAYTELFEALGG